MYMSAEGKNFYIGINRNIVECKYMSISEKFMQGEELIETLWNVNCFKFFLGVLPCLELIETLWNVNMFGNKRHISTLRGN